MKQKIRDELRKKRDILDLTEIQEKSSAILKKLQALTQYKKAKAVCYYVSIGSEVYTHDLIKQSFDKKKVIVPKVVDEHLELAQIHAFDDLTPGYFGILEPKESHHLNINDADLVLVAGLAFDRRGHRIGYGKGYYDGLLKDFNGSKIGLCFDFQLVEKIPNEDWDVTVDGIITEKAILHCP